MPNKFISAQEIELNIKKNNCQMINEVNRTDEDVLDLRENTRIHDGELGRGQDTFDQAKVLNL